MILLSPKVIFVPFNFFLVLPPPSITKKEKKRKNTKLLQSFSFLPYFSWLLTRNSIWFGTVIEDVKGKII